MRPLPAAGSLAAYRITQEALTNARKHGDGGPIAVRFTYGRDRLQMEIANGVRPATGPEGSGYGLIGMRERATAAGGTVETTKGQDRFLVRVSLPAPSHHEE